MESEEAQVAARASSRPPRWPGGAQRRGWSRHYNHDL